MKSILVELTCQHCMFHTYRKSETLVLSDFEAQARCDLLKDSFFSMICPQCKHTITFIHPLAYVDNVHQFILLVKSKKDFVEEDHLVYKEDLVNRKRFVYHPHHISEKIKIFESHLDDRNIELLKYQIKRKYKQQKQNDVRVEFHDMDTTSNTLWFTLHEQDIVEYIAVLMESYDKVQPLVPLEVHDHYMCIDEDWAKSVLKT